MTERDRRGSLACLAGIEANMAELQDTVDWWGWLSPGQRLIWKDFASTVRMFQHDLNELSRGDEVAPG
jgi:hypothetical protein